MLLIDELDRADEAQIKVEVTPVLRGCVYEPERRAVSAARMRQGYLLQG